MNKTRMRKFYFAVLGEFSKYSVGWRDEEFINQTHEELKAWRNIRTTTRMNHQQRQEYIEYVIAMFSYVRLIRFDSDRYKYDNVSYIILSHNTL